MSFDERLARGQVAEVGIGRWLIQRGWTVLPAYQMVNTGQFKGPQLFAQDRSWVTPDMLTCRQNGNVWTVAWIEAKHKEAFTYYRIGGYWETGIDLRHYLDYQDVAKRTPWPVWLMFLHRGGQAKDSPAQSPAGLYGQSLAYLVEHESHRSDRYASGMVYWAKDTLKKLATVEEVME